MAHNKDSKRLVFTKDGSNKSVGRLKEDDRNIRECKKQVAKEDKKE